MEGLTPETIRHALSVAQASGLTEVEVRSGEEAFSAVFESVPAKGASPKPARTAVIESIGAPTSDEQAIGSPFVGYYRAHDPPLRPGQFVEKGEIVASIAALGLAHDVESPFAGEISEVLVEPGQAVEFGQPLARLRS